MELTQVHEAPADPQPSSFDQAVVAGVTALLREFRERGFQPDAGPDGWEARLLRRVSAAMSDVCPNPSGVRPLKLSDDLLRVCLRPADSARPAKRDARRPAETGSVSI